MFDLESDFKYEIQKNKHSSCAASVLQCETTVPLCYSHKALPHKMSCLYSLSEGRPYHSCSYNLIQFNSTVFI